MTEERVNGEMRAEETGYMVLVVVTDLCGGGQDGEERRRPVCWLLEDV